MPVAPASWVAGSEPPSPGPAAPEGPPVAATITVVLGVVPQPLLELVAHADVFVR